MYVYYAHVNFHYCPLPLIHLPRSQASSCLFAS
jgi:hypothetical protein